MELKKIQLLGAIFATLLMVGCASQTTDDTDATDSMDTSAETMESEAMTAEEEARAAMERLEAAADAAGRVFYFEFDQATLTAETRVALDAHVALLKENNAKVRLEGHADERGTRECNMALGERRANAVANYMIINGIPRYRIETVSYGEERPAMNASNESAWAKNRRVELQ